MRNIKIRESPPAEMSLLLVGVNSRAVGVSVCSCRVPRCLLLVEDLALTSGKVGGCETEEQRV